MKALFLVIALALAGGMLAAACGGDNTSSTPTVASQSTAPSSSGGAAAVGVASTSLGQVVTDTAGFTLYEFDKDTAGNGKSACTASCATTWPPATTSSASPAKSASLSGALTTITRDDGTMQLALDGHPLYRYSADKAAGDTNGDGVGGIWHVAKASGAAAAASPTAAASSGSGYNY
ncbi:MAG: COG4315 family predicted lipoprotein [Tepidiformaceae bacterium]